MLLGIDHLVIAVHDPDASAATLEADLGIAFTGGGRHEAWGTFNRLAFLGDTYLELIGVFDRALVAASGTAVGRAALAVLDAGAEGLATFALATDDIAGDVARLQAAGSLIGAPVEGARTRPDGDTVRWRTAAAALGPCEPPFLIEHAYEGAEWDDAARAARAAFEHPSGGHVRLTQLELQCAEPRALAAACARTVGTGVPTVGRRSRCRRWSSGRPAIERGRRAADDRAPGRPLAGVSRHRQPGDPVAMRGLTVLALTAMLVASGCGIVNRQLTRGAVPDQPDDPSRVGPAVVIGGAADAAGTWRAWVYRTNDGSICLTIRANDNGSSGCSSDVTGITGLGRSTGGAFDYASGGSLKPGATTAAIQLVGGQTATAPLVAVGSMAPGASYFAARLPAGSRVEAVQILDGAGTVLETLTSPDADPGKEAPTSAPSPGGGAPSVRTVGVG